MANLYLDHNVARGVSLALREAGHGVRTAREIGTENAADDEHLALAYEHGWVFVTHNRKDFQLLHSAWRRWSELWGIQVAHSGILIVEPGSSPQRLAMVIDDRMSSNIAITGEIAIWRPLDGWRP